MAVCQNPRHPCSSHQNSWDLWMFIPLKMVLIGIDPYPNDLAFLVMGFCPFQLSGRFLLLDLISILFYCGLSPQVGLVTSRKNRFYHVISIWDDVLPSNRFYHPMNLAFGGRFIFEIGWFLRQCSPLVLGWFIQVLITNSPTSIPYPNHLMIISYHIPLLSDVPHYFHYIPHYKCLLPVYIIVSLDIPYHIISYHIISYHIISYHIISYIYIIIIPVSYIYSIYQYHTIPRYPICIYIYIYDHTMISHLPH